MVVSQHALSTREALQKEYDDLSEEIQYLRKSERTDDLSPRERFRLKKQIEEAEAISDMLPRFPERTVVLIFSDAGAARGGYSEERIEITQKFLRHLKQQVRYLAWLNPMPQKRWYGTTADEIADLVPMFEMTRRGLQDAIDVLRGR